MITARANISDFNARFREYMRKSSREPALAVNTKNFFIARGAVRATPQADKEAIKQFATDKVLIGKMINRRRKANSEPGLRGPEMAAAIGALIKARIRSIAFLKSGWLPAIKALESVVDKKYRRGAAPAPKKSVKVLGAVKGYGRKANPGWSVRSTIANTISMDGGDSRKEAKSKAMAKHADPALAKSVQDEIASMEKYLNGKLAANARSVGWGATP